MQTRNPMNVFQRLTSIGILCCGVFCSGLQGPQRLHAEPPPAPTDTEPGEPPATPPSTPSVTPLTATSTTANNTPALSQKEIYRQGLKSCALVQIMNSQGKMRGHGSGWVFDKQRRLLVTNFHVVPLHSKFRVFFPEMQNDRPISELSHYLKNVIPIAAEVVISDEGRDLAVLKLASIPDHIQQVTLADGSPVPGDVLHSIGNPGKSNGLWIYTTGTVRAVFRNKIRFGSGQRLDAMMIESQSPINPGDSGGPAFDSHGHLVGVVSSHNTKASLISHFIDVTEVRKVTADGLEIVEPTTAVQFFKRGRQHRSRQEYEEALADLNTGLQKNPRSLSARTLRASCLFELGREPEALADLQETLQRNPEHLPAYFARIRISEKRKRHEDVIADANAILAQSPSNASALSHRGVALQAKQDLEHALADFDQAIQIEPKVPLYYFQRGELHRQAGRFEPALKEFEQALKLEPHFTRVYPAVGALLARDLNDPARAVKFFTTMIRKDPKNGLAFGERGRAQFLHDQLQLAEEDFDAAIRLQPKNARLHHYRGELRLAQRNFTEALEDYQKAESLDPKNTDFHIDLGNVQLQLNNDREALAEFEEALKLNPQLATAYVRRAVVHFKLGNNANSDADLQTARQLDPQLPPLEIKRRFSRFLRVTNPRNEPLDLQVYYRVKGKSGKESWFPAEPPNGQPATFRLGPRETTLLKRTDVAGNIHAAIVRIWAKGTESGTTLDEFRNSDLRLCPEEGYVSAEPETYDFSFRK